MSQVRKEILEANKAYVAEFGDKGKLAIPPARKFAVLTCMDARMDPAKFAGLAEGDAHVIRNAGGRASDDAIRSLVVSTKLLGTREWFVIHHTNCAAAMYTNEEMGALLEASLETAVMDEDGWHDDHDHEGSEEGKKIDWLAFADAANAVTDDVKIIRDHPLVPGVIPIYGYVYDVRTGKLEEVAEASEAGKAR